MEDDRRNWRSEGSHPALLFLLWTGWKREREKGEQRDRGPQTGLISCVGSCQGQVQPPQVQETRVATKPQQVEERGSAVWWLTRSKEPMEIYSWAEICFLLICNLQSFGEWGSGYQGPLIKGWLWTLHWKTFGVKFTLKLFFTKKFAVHFANN